LNSDRDRAAMSAVEQTLFPASPNGPPGRRTQTSTRIASRYRLFLGSEERLLRSPWRHRDGEHHLEGLLVRLRARVRARPGLFERPTRRGPDPSSKANAAEICARCVSPCGKLPSISLLGGAYCSANNPRSFAAATACLNACSASLRRLCRARHSASQKVQHRNTPSCPFRPSRLLYLRIRPSLASSLLMTSVVRTMRSSLKLTKSTPRNCSRDASTSSLP